MKPKRKILSLLLTICLIVGLIPTVAFAADTGKAIQLGASNINGYDSTYDYIYYGNWSGSPIKWRVLDDQTNTGGSGLFLLSDALLGTSTWGGVYFDKTEPKSKAWQGSDAQAWCNTFYSGNLTTQEQGAVLATTKSDSAYTSTSSTHAYGVSSLSGDKVFFLSAKEAETSAYGFGSDDDRKANYGNDPGYWWLRSPCADDTDFAGLVYGDGHFHHDVVDSSGGYAARPAFNLDLKSVLFTSAAEGGKAANGMDSGLTAVGGYDGNEWKLTLLDSSRNFSVTEETASGKPGDTITLNYTGATVYNAESAPNEYISVIIADDSGAQYYGRVAQPTSVDGQVEITIPTSLADGTYTLNVFSEQYNGGANDDTKLTDYASAFEAVSLTVSSDTTAPTLTAGEVSRTSDTSATVKFTSNEAGSYYYEVVDSGESQPDIDTTEAGTSCDTAEQTISLTTLTAGAKDIYIVVKDAAGNVSEKLKITIPAYIAPSYGISASPETLNFGSETVGYEAAPAAQTVTVTNTGNQNVTVTLPTSTNYIITAGTGFTSNTANLTPSGTATFTVQPNTGLGTGTYDETLTVTGTKGGNSAQASVSLAFTVEQPYIPPVVNPDPEEPKPDPTPDYVPEGLNTEDHYAYLIGNGGLIRPEDDITRAEVAAIFFRLLTDETRQAYWSIQSGFTDVSEGNWFNTAVSTLTNLGVLHGYQDGSFQPNAPISRAEFTAIAARFFDYTAEYEDGTFPDVHESNWYADEVQAAVDMGLIQGYPTGVFAPGDSITRGEACAIVNRVLNRRPHEEHLLDREEMNTWPDNTGDRWFYEDVQEASNTHDYDWILEDGQTVEEWTAKLPDPDWAAIEYGG